ncbi:MAG TPA: putative Ig domain-containing protein, partial [Bryobacteraceae bacterium]|nr:putative Ig domain-containing protein [Bryobacteraceae bacterium]
VTDSSTPPLTAERSFAILPGGQITSSGAPPVGNVGQSYSFILNGALGSGGVSIILGALPPGLAIDPNGAISGTPTTTGSYDFTVRQTIGLNSIWRSYRILVTSPISLANTPREASEQFAYDEVLQASGGVGPYNFAITSGSIASGITLDPSGALYGESYPTESTFDAIITITDAAGNSVLVPEFEIVRRFSVYGNNAAPSPVRVNSIGTGTVYNLQFGDGNYQYELIGGDGVGNIFVTPSGPYGGSVTYSFPEPGPYVPVVLGTDGIGSGFIFREVVYRAIGNLSISTVALPNGRVGQSYSAAIDVANGDFTPLTYSISAGSLPTGLTINSGTGEISGIVSSGQGGLSFPITVQVADSNGQSTTKNLFIGVGNSLGITTNVLPAVTSSTPYNVTLTQTGATGPSWSYTGTLPPGLNFTSAGVISGTPTTPGDYTITVTLSHTQNADTDHKTYTIHVTSPLSVTPPTNPWGVTVGVSADAVISITGGRQPYVLSLASGALPEGIRFTSASQYGIAGTPQLAGLYNVIIVVTDADGLTQQFPFTINVRTAPRIITEKLATATNGVAYSSTINVDGGIAPYVYTLDSGTMPPGLTLQPNGTITGTPTSNGEYSFGVLLTDGNGSGDERNFSLEVNPPLVITNNVPMPAGTILANYSTNVLTTGGTTAKTYTISAGNLPPLLDLDLTSGNISTLPLLPGSYSFTVKVTDRLGRTATQAQQITIGGNIGISPAYLTNGTLAIPYSATFTSAGATGIVVWTVPIGTGSLPPGLTLNPTTGVLSGTPTTAGTYTFNIQAQDATSNPPGVATYSLIIGPGLSIAPTTLPNGLISTAYSQTLTSSNAIGSATWSIASGALPPGISLTPSTGAIAGTPTAAGSYNFTVEVTDLYQQLGRRSYTLVILNTLSISPTTLTSGRINTAYTQTFTAAPASGAVNWILLSGAFPPGLTLTAATGTLAGTPTTPGSYTFTVQATDNATQTGQRQYTLQILDVLTISPATLPNGVPNTAYSQTLTATGATGGVTWSISAGALPPGLLLAPSTGALGGTPTTPGSYTFTVTATDSLTQTGARQYNVIISGALTVNPGTLPDSSNGVAYSQTVTAAGAVGSVSWSITAGELPTGLTLAPTTGIISGTPTVNGEYTFTVTAMDSIEQTGSRAYTVHIADSMVISPASIGNGATGLPYSQTLTAAPATGTLTWSLLAGALPPGLSLDPATGIISGTPTLVGTYEFNVQVTSTSGGRGTRAYAITVAQPLLITTASPLPEATQAEAYSTQLAVNQLPSTSMIVLTWSATGLPAGLTIGTNTGIIAGTPTAGGVYSVNVTVSSSGGGAAAKTFALTVYPQLLITTSFLSDASQNSFYSAQLAGTGGKAPYVWSLESSLPAGLSLNAANGQISGTTSAQPAGYPLRLVLTDARSRVARRTLNLGVIAPPSPPVTLSPDSVPNGHVNQAYRVVFSGSGGSPGYTFSLVSGSLPPGISLAGGVLSGTPTLAGTYRFSINMTDSGTGVAGNLYTLIVEPAIEPLTVTPAAIPPNGVLAQPLSLQFGATGGTRPYTFSISGGTPPGMSANSSGLLSGTPSEAGSYTFTVTATDSRKPQAAVATRTYSINITGALIITTLPPLPDGQVGAAYSVGFGASGGRAPYSWSITGNTPPGLSFDPASGSLSGTPTTQGAYSFSVEVRDAQRLTATSSFSIAVFDALEITNAPSDAPLTPGQPYSFGFSTRGGKPPVSFSLSGGSLPPGLGFSGSGVISGTPTAGGHFAFSVLATDGLGNKASRSAALQVGPPLEITTATLPNGRAGTDYSSSVAATGGVAPLGAWSITQGSLPAGLSFSADGTISGKPTAAGTSSFTVRISDSAGGVATRSFSITIALPPVPPLTFVGLPQTLPPGTQTNITIQLAEPFPLPVTGTLTLFFEPNAVNNSDDPSVQFSSGGRTVTFTIPAGQTTGTFPVDPLRLLSGTVAGTVRIVTTTQPASATPVPETVLPIVRSAPVITAGAAQLAAAGFTLTVDGFSNTREITSANFRLTPVPGTSLGTTDIPVSVASAFTTWYQSAASNPFGGLFRMTLPFNVAGSLADIDSVVVTVTNSVGVSQPFTIRLR